MLRASGGDYHKGAEISLSSTRDFFVKRAKSKTKMAECLCTNRAYESYTRLKVSNLSMNEEFNDVSIQVRCVRW